ncbi:MAG: hypothetical protein K6C34_04140 [Alphaproteobacteria bacterium]|nr:hypothetical protein [Alphaproteobacteria bacterium]
MKKIIFALCAIPCLCLCAENTTTETQEETVQTTDNKFNLAAKQLAGSYIPNEFLNDPEYLGCIESVKQRWETLLTNSLGHVKAWAETNISPHITDANTVFYPFGGPDIAYAMQFFPQADTYVLLGLEPIGSFAHIEKNLSRKETFKAVDTAISAYLDKGFFITSEMMTQLSNRDVRGCVYLLLLQLSKLGYKILSVEDISINCDGNEVQRGNGELDALKMKCAKDGVTKTVYYLRIDFSKATKLPHIFNFMHSKKFVTLIKSASYALHNKEFSKVRAFILDNSQAVLQDDTGIPFYFFDSKWEKYPFGVYTQPTLPVFERFRQQTLSDFFAQNDPKPISFKIGYGFYQNRPNLLLAIPKERKLLQEVSKLSYENMGKGCNCGQKKTIVIKRSEQAAVGYATSVYKKSFRITVERKNGQPAIARVELVK